MFRLRVMVIGIGEKFKNLLHRKSIDERVDEAFSASTGRESFSKKVWEANLQAHQKLRAEVPSMAKSFIKRPEERYNPYYPGVYEGPHGNPHEEGPLTTDFDRAQPRSEFGRFDEDMRIEQNQPSGEMAHGNMVLSHHTQNIQPPRVDTPMLTPDMGHAAYPSQKPESRPHISNSDMRELMEELRGIREQNAIIIEKLKTIERKLENR